MTALSKNARALLVHERTGIYRAFGLDLSGHPEMQRRVQEINDALAMDELAQAQARPA